MVFQRNYFNFAFITSRNVAKNLTASTGTDITQYLVYNSFLYLLSTNPGTINYINNGGLSAVCTLMNYLNNPDIFIKQNNKAFNSLSQDSFDNLYKNAPTVGCCEQPFPC